MTVLLIVNRAKPGAVALIDEMTAFCRSRHADTAVCFSDGAGGKVDPEKVGLVVTLGGDGTVLYAARRLRKEIPVVAVNLGTVGFITEWNRENWKEALELFFDGRAVFSRRLMLSVGLKRGGATVIRPALNEAAVCAEGIAKLTSLDLSIDGSFVGRIRADGLLCATPTGSTAYSAAAGGPICDPETEVLLITPVCPYTLSGRPLVVPSHKTVTVTPSPENKTPLVLTLDGQEAVKLNREDSLTVRLDQTKLLLVKDSYANCFVPFLTSQFREIVLVDPRYYYGDLESLTAGQSFTDVLFLYNLNTFLTGPFEKGRATPEDAPRPPVDAQRKVANEDTHTFLFGSDNQADLHLSTTAK